MTWEDNIKEVLIKKFPSLEGRIRVQRARRIFAEVDAQDLQAVFAHASNFVGFCILCAITGLDEGQNLALIYHIAREDGIILSIKTSVPKATPVIMTVTHRFPGAEIYEREAMDLFGIKVEGLLEGNRYPLPDDWPEGEYPLRKDWKAKVPAPEKKESS